MATGKVTKVKEQGFGFIDYGHGKDIFFHVSGLKDRNKFEMIQEGDRVTFDVDVSGERPRAINVELIPA